MRHIWIVATLLTCCAGPAPLPEPPPPAPPPPPAMPAPGAAPKPVVAVAKSYRDVARKEVPAVIAPDATPDSVRAIHDADRAAQHALMVLEAEGHHPTPQAIASARAAVRHLSDLLNPT